MRDDDDEREEESDEKCEDWNERGVNRDLRDELEIDDGWWWDGWMREMDKESFDESEWVMDGLRMRVGLWMRGKMIDES